jgi:hypothetical protein
MVPATEIGQQNEHCKALVTFLVLPIAVTAFRAQAAITPLRSASGRSNDSCDSGTGRLNR